MISPPSKGCEENNVAWERGGGGTGPGRSGASPSKWLWKVTPFSSFLPPCHFLEASCPHCAPHHLSVTGNKGLERLWEGHSL